MPVESKEVDRESKIVCNMVRRKRQTLKSSFGSSSNRKRNFSASKQAEIQQISSNNNVDLTKISTQIYKNKRRRLNNARNTMKMNVKNITIPKFDIPDINHIDELKLTETFKRSPMFNMLLDACSTEIEKRETGRTHSN